jgi:molybdopterin molybdotransferase
MVVASAAAPENRQRIARLTPLEDLLRHIDEHVHPVEPREMFVAEEIRATLAQDVVAAEKQPARPIALIDGWAVRADATSDAGGYAPAVLREAHEVETGDPLPSNCDAVAPLDTVTSSGGQYHAHEPVNAGDGVLMPGVDATPGEVLRQAGTRLRFTHSAVLQATGTRTAIVRWPRVVIYLTRKWGDPVDIAAWSWLGDAVSLGGGLPTGADHGTGVATVMDTPMVDGGTPDAAIVIGGTGTGRRDRAVAELARAGTVVVHGVALSPGETTAFGLLKSRPVLLVPARLDAAIAAWLLIGRVMLARLCGSELEDAADRCVLKSKVTSTVGVTELIPVRRVADGVEPLASRYLPLATLAQADGWIVVPAASEGLAAGASVTVRPLP